MNDIGFTGSLPSWPRGRVSGDKLALDCQHRLNWYAYVGNDPINYTDPSGECPFCFLAVLFTGGATTVSAVTVTAATISAAQVATLAAGTTLAGAALSSGGGSTSKYRQTQNNDQSKSEKQNKSHKYIIDRTTLCSADDAFRKFKSWGMSAPGAPTTKEGFSSLVKLWGIPKPNPISQFVNSSTRTIINTTLPGHVFYPGQVNIQVSPLSGGGSAIKIIGTGVGNNPFFNDAAGIGFFGTVATEIMQSCNTAAGIIPYGP